MALLHISAPTIQRWVKMGKIKATKQPNGQYNYDDESVYRLAGKMDTRMTIIYSRVSTYKQKQDLINQNNNLENFCAAKGWTIDKSFSEVASGLTFEKRKQFFELLSMIENNKVKRIVITHKDRLSRVGFDMFKNLFDMHGTEIVVMSNELDEKSDKEEIFEEIISLLHCFSMKMYSRRRQEVRKALKESGDNVHGTTIKQRKK